MSHIPHVNTLPQSGINTFLQTVSHKSCPLPSLLNNFQQRIISLLPTMKWFRITQTWQLLHGMLRVSTALKSCLFIYQHSFRSNIYQCKNHTNSCTSSKTLFLKTKIVSNLHNLSLETFWFYQSETFSLNFLIARNSSDSCILFV